MKPRGHTLLALTLAVFAVSPGRASAEPHTRTGFFVGFGLGSGNASWDWFDGRSSEWSGSGSLRLGMALANDFLLGLEAWRWSHDYQVETSAAPVPVEAGLTAVTLAATYFPGNAGFFLRGGVGVADGRVDVSPPSGVSFPVSGQTRDTGVAVLGALGYEMRLTSRFALGAEGDVVYLGVAGEAIDTVFGYGIAVELNWYW